MSGLYFHIPFCRKACTYCDFHFSTSLGAQDRVLDAMSKELNERASELGGDSVGTIYFGGGTPSLIDPARIATFVQQAHALFRVVDAEITLEANPDDITPERLDAWKAAGITRISLGTQSFREDRLKWMGRAHTATQALESIAAIARAGFASWTIDLIYGLPEMTLAEWDEQLSIALDHGMPHLSAYGLTVEPRTALAHQVKQGLIVPGDDEAQSAQFDRLMERMKRASLTHYEISNFGREGHFSRHNTSYWNGTPYLGIGPSAHSFNGSARRWNVSNNQRYLVSVEGGTAFSEMETLTPSQRTNELLLTGLRTQWGVDLDALPLDVRMVNERTIVSYHDRGMLERHGARLVLTERGRHFADRIAMDLFVTE
ncbi:MAG: radical SAM family heme chaperone HemW [Flavobacteriales bacterium]|nr:radical SAM family heme chaperone HemW [Flavobacteriales bacterium]MBK7269854.1 radical SAM family heme chaperone HemW [Flavobacteriales bacterium]MBK7752694.1 radical SAM family heme chaperone HemW [Flavobacteriales bacterium]MBK9076633.1 radical SAM family heme chaperone HemW [Flavobacteriales bacterium]